MIVPISPILRFGLGISEVSGTSPVVHCYREIHSGEYMACWSFCFIVLFPICCCFLFLFLFLLFFWFGRNPSEKWAKYSMIYSISAFKIFISYPGSSHYTWKHVLFSWNPISQASPTPPFNSCPLISSKAIHFLCIWTCISLLLLVLSASSRCERFHLSLMESSSTPQQIVVIMIIIVHFFSVCMIFLAPFSQYHHETVRIKPIQHPGNGHRCKGVGSKKRQRKPCGPPLLHSRFLAIPGLPLSLALCLSLTPQRKMVLSYQSPVREWHQNQP